MREASVLAGAVRRGIAEDTILHSHRRENLKSYLPCFCLFVLCNYVLLQFTLDFMLCVSIL
jgi:hypothetical protein